MDRHMKPHHNQKNEQSHYLNVSWGPFVISPSLSTPLPWKTVTCFLSLRRGFKFPRILYKWNYIMHIHFVCLHSSASVVLKFPCCLCVNGWFLFITTCLPLHDFTRVCLFIHLKMDIRHCFQFWATTNKTLYEYSCVSHCVNICFYFSWKNV